MRLYLVRHGTTEWMEEKRLHGTADSPLSEKGLQQAKQAGLALKDIPIDHIYCSPQGRAQQTAACISEEHGLSIESQEWLREMDFGIFEGSSKGPYQIPYRFIRHRLITLLHIVDSPRYGESWNHVRQRVSEGWQRLLDEGLHGNVLMVSHTLTLQVFLDYLAESYCRSDGSGLIRTFLQPASISELDIDLASGQMEIIRLNDASHYQQPAG